MPLFVIKKLKIQAKLEPKALEDPHKNMHLFFQTLLLKYSRKLKGIPITYNITGMSQRCPIYGDCPLLYVNCLVDFLVLNIDIDNEKDCILHCKGGLFMGVFTVDVGINGYTGWFKVCDLYTDEKSEAIVFEGEPIQ